jgi:hypothetical protein
LYLLPAMILAPVHTKRGNIHQAIKARARKFLQHQWGPLLDGYDTLQSLNRRTHNVACPDAPSSSSSSSEADTRRLKEALKLCQAGQLAKATMRLQQVEGPVPVTVEVLHKLREKHPAARALLRSQDFGVSGLEIERIRITWGLLSDALRASPTGKSAGCSGWRTDYLRQVAYMHMAKDAPVRVELTRFMDTVANGEVPRDFVRTMTLSQLIAVPKPGRPADVRPIAMADCWLKIADRCLLMQTTKEISQLMLSANQLAVSVPGGVEAAVRALQILHDDDPENLTISLDLRNAYNEVSRSAMVKAVRRHVPQWLPYVRFLYATQSELLVYMADGSTSKVYSAEGVRQGAPLSSVLFALTILDPLIEVKGAERDITVLAIADDVALTGRPAAAFRALKMFQDILPSTGLTLQMSKVYAFSSSDQPAATSGYSWLEGEGAQPAGASDTSAIRFVSDGMTMGGAPIGSQPYVGTFLQKQWERITTIAARIVEFSHFRGASQAAALLLRFCLEPKANHMLRTISARSGRMRDWAVRLDAHMAEVRESVLHVDLQTLPVPGQLHLPIRRGGFGATQLEVVAPMAFLASWALTAHLLHRIPAVHRAIVAAEDGVCGQEWSADLQYSIERVTVLTGEPPDLGFEDYTQGGDDLPPTRGLQGVLLQQYYSHKFGDGGGLKGISFLTPFQYARMASLAVPGALDWLTAVPYSGDLYSLSDEEFRAAISWFFGLPQPVLASITFCSQGHLTDKLGVHYVNRNCSAVSAVTDGSGNWKSIRHDIIVRTLRQMIEEIGLRSTLEPGGLPGDATRYRRADLKIFAFPTDNLDTLVDVTVASPYTSDLTLRHSSAGHVEGDAAQRAEDAKLKSYAFLDTSVVRFVPFAFDTYGAAAPRAASFLRDLSVLMAEKSVSSDSGPEFDRAVRLIHAKWRKRLSVTLFRETVRCILSGASRSSDAPAPAHHSAAEHLLDPGPAAPF